MDDLKAENERAWLAYRNSPAFYTSFAGQKVAIHEQLQLIEAELRRELGPILYGLLNLCRYPIRLLTWMRILR